MSLASTTQAIKRLQSTLQELQKTLASTPAGTSQFSQIASQIDLATAALGRYQRAQSEFARSMQAAQVASRNKDPNYIPTPGGFAGGPKIQGNSTAGNVGENAQYYVNSLANLRQSLVNVGVSGKATEEILGKLDAQIRSLPEVPTGFKFAGGITGKSITPSGFKFEEIESVAIPGLEKYNKLTGESVLQINARTEAAKRLREEQKRQASEEQRLLQLQTGARADKTLAPVLARAGEAGFGVESLKNIRTEGNTGVRLLEFQKIDPSGVVQKYNATISKLGDVLPEVGRKFRTFGQSVLRDVGELTKWSIAMAVIYGPIQKVSEITSLMIANEVKLAEATIAVNNQFSSSEKIFNAAALAANNAGEEINTTIAAFTAAYRATGGGVNETTRFSTAQKLLADSMTLAKLAGIDESIAIDTLSASLRQQGMALTDGSTLLDKWVRTTQVANVDINTLATGFGVMGETADAAGIDVDKLNGIIATVAETGLASGKEAANSARRIVTAFQTPGAIAELQRLGIATEDASGKARSFLEIGQQIYEMSKSGLIAPEAMSNLTLIAGQGVRGQAALSAVLGNFQRIGEVETQSKNAQGGTAAAALEKQLSTAQTAITRFNNAWQEFAQTLGTKGGLLDLFKGLTNGGTELVKVLNGITGALGRATPMVTAMTIAMIAFYRKPEETRRSYGFAFSNMMDKGVQSAFTALNGGSVGSSGPLAGTQRSISSFLATGGASAGLAGKGAFGGGVGAAMSLIPAAMNFAAGDKEKAGADIAGGFLGGVVGGLAGGPMGAMIGSSLGISIGEAFVAFTKPEINTWTFTKPAGVTPGEAGDTSTSTGRQAEIKKLQDKIMEGVGGITANAMTIAANSNIDYINSLVAKGDKEGIAAISPKLRADKVLASQGITPESVMGMKPGDKINKLDAGQVAFALSLDEESKSVLLNLINTETKAGNNPNVNPTADYIKSFQTGASAEITRQAISQVATELSGAMSSGKIKSSLYASQLGNAQGAATTLPVWQAALGQKGGDVTKTKELLDVIAYGSTEAVTGITNLAQAIIDLQTGVEKGSPEELKARIDAMKAAFSEEALNVKLAQAPIRGITGDVNQPMTSAELSLVTQRAKTLQKGYYSSEAGGKLSDTETAAYIKKTFEPAAVPIKDAADLFYKVIEGIDPQFFKNAMEQLAKEGKLKSQDQGGIDFQVFKDVDRATLEKLAGQSVSIGQSWQQKFGYGGKAEDQIAIAKDGVAKPIHADFKILAMLLEKLVDQGQKQLDGMFNMPDGANFWVNLAAAQMHMETANANSLNNLIKGLYSGDAGGATAVQTTPVVSQQMKVSTPDLSNPNLRSKSLSDAAEEQRKKDLNSFYSNMLSNPALGPRKPLSDRRDAIGDARSNPIDTTRMPNGDMRGAALNTVPNMTQTLNMNFRTTTTVVLDGRAIGQAVQAYFASSMNKMNSVAGNTSKDYVV